MSVWCSLFNELATGKISTFFEIVRKMCSFWSHYSQYSKGGFHAFIKKKAFIIVFVCIFPCCVLDRDISGQLPILIGIREGPEVANCFESQVVTNLSGLKTAMWTIRVFDIGAESIHFRLTSTDGVDPISCLIFPLLCTRACACISKVSCRFNLNHTYKSTLWMPAPFMW